MRPLPQEFINRFIRKPMQDRVAHEWRKRPERLYYRVCHKAEEIFPESFKGGTVQFDAEETVLLLCGRTPSEVSFSEAEAKLGMGLGAMLIAIDGKKFIAETETTKGHPYVTYAGG